MILLDIGVGCIDTFVVDTEHKRASLAVEERTDVLGHGVWQVRVEISAAQLELPTASLATDVFATNVELDSTHVASATMPSRENDPVILYAVAPKGVETLHRLCGMRRYKSWRTASWTEGRGRRATPEKLQAGFYTFIYSG